jgi:methionyl-tRNA synthetase
MPKTQSKNFYITTTLPYVNSDPHIGFAMEIIRADIIARYKKLHGYEVFFNTGTDEHGLKIFRKAEELGISPQEHVDKYADKFKALIPLLGISEDIVFTRTTDEHHIKSAEGFWKRCNDNGFIYKKNYTINYCSGCELEKSNSDLVNGHCPDHPSLEIEKIEEENYFFKFSEFQQKLLDLYKNNPEFVIPAHRLNEIKSFVERGLNDFSISRLKDKMPWGIEVPGDSKQVMYVWFDALVNYISTIGWPDNMDMFNKWHIETGGMVQYCGKDNLRQQAAMWQAMLMSVNLPTSKTIIVNGFITGVGGVKMSKSSGDVINPVDIVDEYGADALRYYVAREIVPFEDTPFTKEMFKDAYNANLANGLGNLVSRIMKMAVSYGVRVDETGSEFWTNETVIENLEKYDIQKYCDEIWVGVRSLDSYIQINKPFSKIKTDEEGAKKDLLSLLINLRGIAMQLLPIMPDTAEKILELIKENKMPEIPLFVRKD